MTTSTRKKKKKERRNNPGRYKPEFSYWVKKPQRKILEQFEEDERNSVAATGYDMFNT